MEMTEKSVFKVPCKECGKIDWKQEVCDYPIFYCGNCGERIWSE